MRPLQGDRARRRIGDTLQCVPKKRGHRVFGPMPPLPLAEGLALATGELPRDADDDGEHQHEQGVVLNVGAGRGRVGDQRGDTGGDSGHRLRDKDNGSEDEDGLDELIHVFVLVFCCAAPYWGTADQRIGHYPMLLQAPFSRNLTQKSPRFLGG